MSPNHKSIKILIVDDHQVILDSLSLLLNSMPNIDTINTLNSSLLVEQYLENNHIDLLITDYHMPDLNGIDLCLALRNKPYCPKILMLTMAEDAPHIREAIRAGINGYVLKKTGRDELEKAIDKIMSGKKYFSEAVIEELAGNFEDDFNNALPETIQILTEREIEILKLIALEMSSNQIADKLFISLSTVETHRRNLFHKLNVKSGIGLAKYAFKHGLID